MRNWAISLIPLSLGCVAAPCWSVPEGATIASPQAARTDEEQARIAYNVGLTLVETADHAAGETDATAQERARTAYAEARGKFQEATQLDQGMPGAWNMVGYTERKLGNYDQALAAYEHALTLRPNYAEALEYRGEAYLGLNRIADAQQAYLDLFAANRALSDQFLASARNWIEARRKAPGNVSAAALKEFDRWVQERTAIAAKTAALTREGAAAGWR